MFNPDWSHAIPSILDLICQLGNFTITSLDLVAEFRWAPTLKAEETWIGISQSAPRDAIKISSKNNLRSFPSTLSFSPLNQILFLLRLLSIFSKVCCKSSK